MIFKAYTVLLISSLGLSACNKSEVVEDSTTQISSQLPILAEDASKNSPTRGSSDQSGVSTQDRPAIESYPPIFSVYPLALPEPDHPFYFGFAEGATRPYQTVFAYIVAAVPDFNYENMPPVFLSLDEYEAFMNDWSDQLNANPEYVEKLESLSQSFEWQVDPAFFSKEAVNVPEIMLKDVPDFARKTQKVLARRLTTKAAGNTKITGMIGGRMQTIDITINGYTAVQVEAGKTRYQDPTLGCMSCHGNPGAKVPFLRHSSDNLAYYTDEQLVGFVKDSSYPDGTLLNDGLHKFAFASPEEELSMLAYLRNMPPHFDKLLEILTPSIQTLEELSNRDLLRSLMQKLTH